MPVRDGVPGSEQSTPAGPAADTSPMLRCRRRGHRPGMRPANIGDVPGRCRVCSTFAVREAASGDVGGDHKVSSLVNGAGSGLELGGGQEAGPLGAGCISNWAVRVGSSSNCRWPPCPSRFFGHTHSPQRSWARPRRAPGRAVVVRACSSVERRAGPPASWPLTLSPPRCSERRASCIADTVAASPACGGPAWGQSAWRERHQDGTACHGTANNAQRQGPAAVAIRRRGRRRRGLPRVAGGPGSLGFVA